MTNFQEKSVQATNGLESNLARSSRAGVLLSTKHFEGVAVLLSHYSSSILEVCSTSHLRHSAEGSSQEGCEALSSSPQNSSLGHFSSSGSKKPNFLFRASFYMKLRRPGVFFDALHRSAIDFYLGVRSRGSFSKIRI